MSLGIAQGNLRIGFPGNVCGQIFWFPYGDGSKLWYLVNPKIAGKWMFIPLKMYL